MDAADEGAPPPARAGARPPQSATAAVTTRGRAPLDRRVFKYSVVIPVFNSEAILGQTVGQVVGVLQAAGLEYEIVLVNDGSRDRSWDVAAELARGNPHIVAIDLLRNYGQHNANLAGLREAKGDYVITMDDDGQNPADQLLVLIDQAMTGSDVVFGAFDRKQAPGFRRLGSKLIHLINRRIFGQPKDLVVSNFRILRRDVVTRICASQTAHPYITGLALLYSANRSNVAVRHEPRAGGQSQYTFGRLIKLVLTILFSYSSYPLRLAATGGFFMAALSFLLGAIYLLMGIFGDTKVQGWTTIVVLLAVFNGFTIALLSMLGEYVVRTLNTVSEHETYHIVDRVSAG